MPTVHSKMLILLLSVLLLLQSTNQNDDVSDLIHSGYHLTEAECILDSIKPPYISTLPPKNVYSEIYNTAFFKHYSGLSQDI